MCSTPFLYISLPLFCTTTTWNFQKLLSYTFLWRKCRTWSRSLFSLLLIFTMHLWALAFLNLSPPLQNFHVALPTKTCILRFFISRSKSLSPFFSLSFVGLPPTFSFSQSFSCSIFQICGHDNFNLSLILQTTRIQKQFPLSGFVFIRLFSCLWFTWRPWLCDFPPK